MKNESEIREKITKIIDDYVHILDILPATIEINAPRAMMQVEVKTKLDVLYWVIGTRRPRFICDDFSKVDQ